MAVLGAGFGDLDQVLRPESAFCRRSLTALPDRSSVLYEVVARGGGEPPFDEPSARLGLRPP